MAGHPQEPLEKDFSNHNGNNGGYIGKDEDPESALQRIRTAGSISISPELFEKLYLSPQNQVKGELRKTFGNPTPVALLGFLLSLSPLSCDLMGWRGAGGNGAASTGVYFFMGGLLMILGGVGEFLLGNTFPSVVFLSFGGFWLSFGATLDPTYGSAASYAAGDAVAGQATQGFTASFAFFLLFMGLLCFIYLICALRINVVFCVIFLTLVMGFTLLAATYWQLAQGNMASAAKLQVAGGAFLFITCMAGWWIFFAQMLAATDFPINLPVGDLSKLIKGGSERRSKTS